MKIISKMDTFQDEQTIYVRTKQMKAKMMQ